MEKGIRHVKENGWDDYINDEFPPSGDIRDSNSGYKTWNECLLFHEFAAIGLTLIIRHKGKEYYFYPSKNGVEVSDGPNCIVSTWPSANDLIRNFEIDGKKLYEIVNEIEEMEWD